VAAAADDHVHGAVAGIDLGRVAAPRRSREGAFLVPLSSGAQAARPPLIRTCRREMPNPSCTPLSWWTPPHTLRALS